MAPLNAVHCCCLSGLTEQQVKLLELRGGIASLEWLAMEALFAFAGVPPVGDPSKHDALERFRLELVRMADFCRVHGWSERSPHNGSAAPVPSAEPKAGTTNRFREPRGTRGTT